MSVSFPTGAAAQRWAVHARQWWWLHWANSGWPDYSLFSSGHQEGPELSDYGPERKESNSTGSHKPHWKGVGPEQPLADPGRGEPPDHEKTGRAPLGCALVHDRATVSTHVWAPCMRQDTSKLEGRAPLILRSPHSRNLHAQTALKGYSRHFSFQRWGNRGPGWRKWLTGESVSWDWNSSLASLET